MDFRDRIRFMRRYAMEKSEESDGIACNECPLLDEALLDEITSAMALADTDCLSKSEVQLAQLPTAVFSIMDKLMTRTARRKCSAKLPAVVRDLMQ